MDINDYQARAADTVQFEKNSDQAITISLLGLSGEVGELSTEYKKKIRDGESYKIFREKIIEEIGDIMWYLSYIATHEDIEFSEILEESLKKITSRWENLHGNQPYLDLEREFFDDGFPEEQKLPREFVAEFTENDNEKGKKVVSIKVNGAPYGDDVRDNARNVDFYRFHDIFHISYATVLGWSPVVRRLLGRKRKGSEIHDEVEDGGRAWVIDEAIAVIVFEYAKDHGFFEGLDIVDYQLLRNIQQLTRHLEVRDCTTNQWEQAILLGYQMWRELKNNGGGRVICNLYEKTMLFEQLNVKETI